MDPDRDKPDETFHDDATFEWRPDDASDPSAEDGTGGAPADPSRRRVGRFELVRLLGRGGMGEVYLALHSKLQKLVALKLVASERLADEVAVARFLREIRLISQVTHPNIVRFENAGEADGVYYLAMEYVPGVTFDQLVGQLGPLGVANACQLIGQAAVGLECARLYGLVHRDIKPSNLMLSAHGAVKILDFGLALLGESPGEEVEELTVSGRTLGTVEYMAPEQAQASRDVDIRADIYSLGCTLYKLLTGQPPFPLSEGMEIGQVLLAHQHEPPPLVEHQRWIPPQLSSVLQRMLAKRPEDRYEIPADVARALAPLAKRCDIPALLQQVDFGETTTVELAGASTIDTAEYLTSSLSLPGLPTPDDAPPATSTEPPTRRPRRRMAALLALVSLVAIAGTLFSTGLLPSRWFSATTPPDPPPEVIKDPPGEMATLDWDQVDWPNPLLLSREFPFEDAKVTIKLSGDLAFDTELDTPNDNRVLQGNEESLLLATRWTEAGKSLTATISFSAPVKDVSFSIYDIDAVTGEGEVAAHDHVVITGSRNGQLVRPSLTSSIAHAQDAEASSLTGRVPVANSGVLARLGTATVKFATSVDQITVTLSNKAEKITTPVRQEIALHDLHFTVDKPFGPTYKLDWDSVDWQRVRWHTFTVGDTDVTFTLSGDNAVSSPSGPGLNDDVTAPPRSPQGKPEEVLRWSALHAQPHHEGQLAIDFSRPVTEVAFDLLEIDADTGGTADEVQVRGFLAGRPVPLAVVTDRGLDAPRVDDEDILIGASPANEKNVARASVRFAAPIDRVLLNLRTHGEPGSEEKPAEASAGLQRQVALGDLHFRPWSWTGVNLPEQSTIRVIVPATAHPRLAGVAANETQDKVNVAPGESPVWVRGLSLQPGGAVSFSASGLARLAPRWVPRDADGVPRGGLVGVFVPENAPIEDYSGEANEAALRDEVMTPELHIPFLIGDGKAPDGRVQKFVVPPEAGRLFLGVFADQARTWFDNVGSFDVQVASHPAAKCYLNLAASEPATLPVNNRAVTLNSEGKARLELSPGRHEVQYPVLGKYGLVATRAVFLAPGDDKTFQIPPPPVDLLTAIDPQRDTLGGKATREGKALLLRPYEMDGVARLQLPLLPPQPYALKLTVERVDESNASVLRLGLRVRDKTCLLSFEQDTGGRFCALRNTSPTRTLRSQEILVQRREDLLPAGKPKELVIYVLERSIELFDGDTSIFSWLGDQSQLGTSNSGPAYPGAMFLRIDSGAVRVDKFELTPISGEPRPFELSPPTASPDRRLAERAIWAGGKVRLAIGGRGSNEIQDLNELPTGMKLHGIYTRDPRRDLPLDDADLALAARVPRLQDLGLSRSHVTDAGVAHLVKLKDLRYLSLSNTRVTDDGLAHLRDLSKLDSLYLAGTSVGDAGMVHLRRLTGLRRVGLSGSDVGDAGLATLAPVLAKANYLCVCGAEVTEKSAPLLAQLTELENLHLGGVPISDEHVKLLHGLKKLRQLRLVDTQVTDAGKQELRRHLPQVKFPK